MKVKNPTTGEYEELVIKANDSIPANGIIEYDGDVVPEGYEKVEDKENVLYDDPNGTIETVTLSETSANFSYLEIFYMDSSTKQKTSAKVANPNGQKMTLSTFEATSTSNQLRFSVATILISDTTITKTTYRCGYITNNAIDYYDSNEIHIYKVVGYR